MKKPNIIHEIADIQKAEIKATGKRPTQIALDPDQLDRLKAWFDSCKTVWIGPGGRKDVTPWPDFDDGLIFGMRFVAK